MSGRRHDIIWLYFHKTKLPGKIGCRAKCKRCGKEIQGLVARMKQHYTDCTAAINLTTDVSNHLGTGKAGKLVFIYKLLNTHK